MLQENKQLSKLYWGRHLLGRGYFVATSGNITDEMIMDYIENQTESEKEDDFSISQS
jgi:putative transposase